MEMKTFIMCVGEGSNSAALGGLKQKLQELERKKKELAACI
jgi:hypothetical protein